MHRAIDDINGQIARHEARRRGFRAHALGAIPYGKTVDDLLGAATPETQQRLGQGEFGTLVKQQIRSPPAMDLSLIHI